MSDSIVGGKSFKFAVRIVNLYKFLQEKKEFVLSQQILRSGTSIGANICEALEAQSDKDFISKMGIALKESAETIYWLRLLRETNYINDSQFESMHRDVYEIKLIISSIIKTKKENMKLRNEK
ncbi:four helix bundle protein [Ruminococcus flavefaciens]|uniref:four helix bundle protein n=1 Tax=Ruminococcus flavefaciens TaxID=1265 RepID=UPI0026E95065|nr:four helix bundle protein [Ruminococcus flavefaciens]